MARDLNRWDGIGRLGNDVDMKFTASGSAVANISLACSDDYKDKNTGQKVEQTEWVRIVAFGKLAEICGEYLKKGSQVYFSGKFTTRKWRDQNGNDRYTSEIKANEMQMLGGKQNSSPGQSQSAPQSNENKPDNTVSSSVSIDDGFDDIPFAPVDGRYV